MRSSRNPIRVAVLFGAMLCALADAAVADSPWPTKVGRPGPALLTADQAFDLVSARQQTDNITVSWTIADGYYLYRKRLVFTSADGKPASWGTPQLPNGEFIDDGHDGLTEIYRGTLNASLPLTAGSPPPKSLRVRYQGCAEAGVCYPPQTRVIDISP